MKRAKYPQRKITTWEPAGPGYLAFVHPSAERELKGCHTPDDTVVLLHGELVQLDNMIPGWLRARLVNSAWPGVA